MSGEAIRGASNALIETGLALSSLGSVVAGRDQYLLAAAGLQEASSQIARYTSAANTGARHAEDIALGLANGAKQAKALLEKLPAGETEELRTAVEVAAYSSEMALSHCIGPAEMTGAHQANADTDLASLVGPLQSLTDVHNGAQASLIIAEGLTREVIRNL
jgi:hypothetical protein